MGYNGKILKEAMENLDKPSKVRVPKNQWQTPGEITPINSQHITMQGVGFDAIGMSPGGYMQHMEDGKDYYFPTKPVVEFPMMANGGYTVTRSSDRKGKTHKVTGPDGSVKYFGDSKLGQHPKDPERKKAFYARHKKNLAGNPYFRAFARKTWEDGGQLDMMNNGGGLLSKSVTCSSCGHSWESVDGGSDPLTCHNCGGIVKMQNGGNLYYDNEYIETMKTNYEKGGEMIRRADGSYSRRGLWDNIRANKGSGKKPTKKMLEQERKIKAKEMKNGGTNNPGFDALPEYVQAQILSNMGYGGYYNPMMADGGESNGEMAMGQMAAVADKMGKLLKFIKPDKNLDPWIASKLAVMDHSADAISDYLMYGPESQEQEAPEEQGLMKKGGTYSNGVYYQPGGQTPPNPIDGTYVKKPFVPQQYGINGTHPSEEYIIEGQNPADVHSVVDYLDLLGMDYSKKNRSVIAQQMGVKNYNYSAKKNNELLEAIKNDFTGQKMGKMPYSFVGNKSPYYQTGGSIVDYLAGKGQRFDKAYRAELAKKYNVDNYDYSAEKNTELLGILRNQMDKQPTQEVKDPVRSSKVGASVGKQVSKVNNGYLPGSPNNASYGFNPYQNPGADKRNLESGTIVDKGTNMMYVINKNKVVKSAPVLTGQAGKNAKKDPNSNPYPVSYLENNPGDRSTPTGTYFMQPNPNIYGWPGYNLNPISAFGEKAPAARATAIHVTYGANPKPGKKGHPDPQEFNRRNAAYSGNPFDRYKSYGCTNAQGQTIDCLQNQFPKGDTAIYIDSRRPADLKYINTVKQRKQFGGGMYQSGGPVVGEEMDVTPQQLEILRAQGYDFEII